MSSVLYRHENNKSMIKDGKKIVIKESIIDGNKGLSFLFLEKEGDEFYRIIARKLDNGEFEIKEKKKDNEEKKNLKESEVMKMLSSNKKLKFVLDYLNNERKKYIKGGKTTQKRSSKKNSKKNSKKK